MKNERKFYKCSHCGNIISFVVNNETDVSCCGEKMQEMKPNTADAASEKHVPVAVRENCHCGNKLVVTVGSVSHPMTEEHHIAWIAVVDGDRTQRVVISNAIKDSPQSPTADFIISENPVTVYAYCNLHGLWVAQIN